MSDGGTLGINRGSAFYKVDPKTCQRIENRIDVYRLTRLNMTTLDEQRIGDSGVQGDVRRSDAS